MTAPPAEQKPRRLAVILGSGGPGTALIDLVAPLLDSSNGVEVKGIFLEEAEIQHAAELPFVKELCRVTFNVKEFTSDQFERTLALRMRTARRALDVLARRAGVAHSFSNVRGSAIRLLRETAARSDITLFQPVPRTLTPMTSRPAHLDPRRRIVVPIHRLETGRRALEVARKLAGGSHRPLSVLLSPLAAGDERILELVSRFGTGQAPTRVRTLPERGTGPLVEAILSENPGLLVIGVNSRFLENEGLRLLRDRLRCPVCLVSDSAGDEGDS